MSEGPSYGILSLCTGIGNLDTAVRRSFARAGIKTHFVAFAEKDPNCSKVLEYHHPDVENIGDVTLVQDWSKYKAAKIIVSGMPCQPFSTGGKRLGIKDERYLWPYLDEAICEIRPEYFVLENVAGIRSSGLQFVTGSLARNGYNARWHSLRASDVGAPHQRERIFLVARSNSNAGS